MRLHESSIPSYSSFLSAALFLAAAFLGLQWAALRRARSYGIPAAAEQRGQGEWEGAPWPTIRLRHGVGPSRDVR